MTANDVRAAAERRRAYKAWCQSAAHKPEDNPYRMAGHKIDLDAFDLADAYLALADGVTLSREDASLAAISLESTATRYVYEGADGNGPPTKYVHAPTRDAAARIRAALEGQK